MADQPSKTPRTLSDIRPPSGAKPVAPTAVKAAPKLTPVAAATPAPTPTAAATQSPQAPAPKAKRKLWRNVIVGVVIAILAVAVVFAYLHFLNS